MYTFRRATPEDAERITRRRMFVGMGHPWIRRTLESSYYTGFLASQGGEVVAGAGLMFLRALHDSEAGRRIYERLGFRASNEMVWRAR